MTTIDTEQPVLSKRRTNFDTIDQATAAGWIPARSIALLRRERGWSYRGAQLYSENDPHMPGEVGYNAVLKVSSMKREDDEITETVLIAHSVTLWFEKEINKIFNPTTPTYIRYP